MIMYNIYYRLCIIPTALFIANVVIIYKDERLFIIAMISTDTHTEIYLETRQCSCTYLFPCHRNKLKHIQHLITVKKVKF